MRLGVGESTRVEDGNREGEVRTSFLALLVSIAANGM